MSINKVHAELERNFEESLKDTKLRFFIRVSMKYLRAFLIRSKLRNLFLIMLKVEAKFRSKFVRLDTFSQRLMRKLKKVLLGIDPALKVPQTGLDVNPYGSFVASGELFPNQESFIKNTSIIKCDVVVCCAFFGRHDVLDQVLSDTLKENSVGICLVGSSVDDLDFIRRLSSVNDRVIGTIIANMPLGAKWQRSIDVALGCFDADLFAITGSDDILPVSTIANIHRHYTEAADKPALYGCRRWRVWYWLQDHFEHGCLECEYSNELQDKTLGAGRFFSRALFDFHGASLFEVRKLRRLDEFGHAKASASNLPIIIYDDMFEVPISLKGPWTQMNDVSEIVNAKTLTWKFASQEVMSKLFDQYAAIQYYVDKSRKAKRL